MRHQEQISGVITLMKLISVIESRLGTCWIIIKDPELLGHIETMCFFCHALNPTHKDACMYMEALEWDDEVKEIAATRET